MLFKYVVVWQQKLICQGIMLKCWGKMWKSQRKMWKCQGKIGNSQGKILWHFSPDSLVSPERPQFFRNLSLHEVSKVTKLKTKPKKNVDKIFVKFVWTPLGVKGQQISNFENRNFSIFISDVESLQKSMIVN